MTRMTGPECAVMYNLINTPPPSYTHTHSDARPGREGDMARLGQANARRLGGRYAGRTDLIPLR